MGHPRYLPGYGTRHVDKVICETWEVRFDSRTSERFIVPMKVGRLTGGKGPQV